MKTVIKNLKRARRPNASAYHEPVVGTEETK